MNNLGILVRSMFFKHSKILTCFFITVIFINVTSCEDSELGRGHPDPRAVVMEGEPYILNVDSSPTSILKFYNRISIEQLLATAGEGDAVQRYLYARILMRDYRYELPHDDAVKILEAVWQEGLVDAGYDLFELYTGSPIVDRNLDVAKEYLVASAELGYIVSQQTLGLALSGRSIKIKMEVDYALARGWYLLAAQQGDVLSAVNLAGLYRKGLGGELDEGKAFSWLIKAEHMPYGDPSYAFDGLALYYENGIGTDVDLVQAYKYYDLLSPAGDDDKARLAGQMTPEQIHEAISLSRQWQEEHNIFVPSYYGLEYQEDGTFQ
ncbi:tetratricopeptide repeat protein [Halomonas cupida]|uniref:tetratricopeptide repeat protein n=1 Tax=Halomonas cupida TaxID=44933 RepID=UPI003EF6CD93